MADVMGTLGRIGLVPVVKIDRASDAVPLGQALIAGGLPCAEITFRTAAAEEAIANLSAACRDDMVIGAGTVLTIDQAERAVRAGARFIVSPGFSPALVDWCLAHDVPAMPGCVTPTEIMAALDKGLKILKFFPAEVYGGIAALKALSAPFGMVKFVPTGGVNAKNLADYLSLGAVHAVGGSWMVEGKLIAGSQWAEITRLAAEACAIVRQVRGG
jgi:2-dehydro-3-deoxyphosphogluconate aldolase / (4S)-4-hydroxy-2-oxoglutarate aldolase